MKLVYLLLALSLLACNQNSDNTTTQDAQTDSADVETITEPAAPSADSTNYSNERFRDVTVRKVGEHTYQIQGQAQVFEAAFSWVVEDGHNELKQGHQMTSAGAPAWAPFDFTVEVQKQEPNSTLMLILYEASANDGSRQHQLPVKLE
ncbi:Gmad2 immunoglobulin-like domain-containing protein [Telluribacter sp. SYSU D00476]|uniref:Gmad2 immunoglobulin-like domain-containing protein n=1 Tax=Telluribacter sp. SYSU D00476 TaxID=2811430 RepID=UPI001FF2A25D|nr:Gmad2 immunoglobulin-like domain-containing protein [Telluribacter sp. SYSU D00476]